MNTLLASKNPELSLANIDTEEPFVDIAMSDPTEEDNETTESGTNILAESTSWLEKLPVILRADIEESHTIQQLNKISGLIKVCSRIEALLSNNPTLFWLVMSYTRQHNWNLSDRYNVCLKPPLDILSACQLPAKEEQLICLDKIDFKDRSCIKKSPIDPTLYQITYRLLQQDVNQLIKRKAIYLNTVDFLYRYPELIDAQFIRNRKSKRMGLIEWKVQDIKRLGKAIAYPKTDKLLLRCRHDRDLLHARSRLQKLVSDEFMNELQKHDLTAPPLKLLTHYLDDLETCPVEFYWSREYPESAIPCTTDIQSLRNYREVIIEAHTQHNCLASYYNSDIYNGELYAYQILAPERATLTLAVSKKGLLQLDQLLLKDNQEVSNKTRKSVTRWLKKGNRYLKNNPLTHTDAEADNQ